MKAATATELSADRANNARRVLKDLDIPEDRVARVVSLAATEPLMPEDPGNARNRRLSIVLLRGTGVQPPLAPSDTEPGAPAQEVTAPETEPAQSGIGNKVQQ